MSIKTRLFLAFGFLVFLVITISSIFIFYTRQTKILLDRSLVLSENLGLWQDIATIFDRQSKSLNYFIILNEKTEKDKFNEYIETIESKIAKIPSVPEKEEFIKLFKKYNEQGKKVFTISHTNVISFHDNAILPLEGQINVLIDTNIKRYSMSFFENEKNIKKASRTNTIISVLFGIFSMSFGGILGFITFRSIWQPLKTLIKGTCEIGDGNLDYKIVIKNKDEIGTLALSFNQMVENLKKLQLQVVQMDRMSSIGQLAGGVAHEINNPLTGVLGQTQLLLTKLSKDDPNFPHLQRIEQAAQRCRRIVRALLDFAREKNYVYSENDVDTLLQETLNFCYTELSSANIEIIKKIQSGLPKVWISTGHIQQVFLNILNNAIYAIAPKKGGKITITAERNLKSVDVSFKDTGIGMSKEVLEHVFDPFFTTKEVGSGTGLGLTVSYGIIQKHNGKIVAKSDGEGSGAEFIVSLPVNPAPCP